MPAQSHVRAHDQPPGISRCCAERAERVIIVNTEYRSSLPMGLLTVRLTFTAHAHFDALLVAAVLALVAVVLIDRTVAVAATRVRQVATHRPLEERLAACVGEGQKVRRLETGTPIKSTSPE